MSETRIDQEAELLVRSLAVRLTDPTTDECLLCFIARMLDEFGCDCTLRFALRYRDLRAPPATGLADRLGRVGGFCDCEVFLNGYRMAERLLEYDADGEAEWPDDAGVWRGATRLDSTVWELGAPLAAWLVIARVIAKQQHQQQNACMVSITIRDVPQETRNELAARAARSGRSLQEYLRGQLVEMAERPDRAEVVARMRERAKRGGARFTAKQILDAKNADKR